MRRTLLKLAAVVLLCVPACAAGCGNTRTVYVPNGEPVRIRVAVKAKIWAADKDGTEVPGEILIPEGWYALPDPADAAP